MSSKPKSKSLSDGAPNTRDCCESIRRALNLIARAQLSRPKFPSVPNPHEVMPVDAAAGFLDLCGLKNFDDMIDPNITVNPNNPQAKIDLQRAANRVRESCRKINRALERLYGEDGSVLPYYEIDVDYNLQTGYIVVSMTSCLASKKKGPGIDG